MRTGWIWLLAVLPPALGVHDTVFCMLTARRPQSYLERAVGSLLEQNVLTYDGVGLVVLDADGSARNVSWATPMQREPAACDTPDVDGVPSCEARQRSLDVITALTTCAQAASGWVVLLEDDCTACQGGVEEVVTALSRLDGRAISLARFSKFQRATAIPAGKVGRYTMNIRQRLYTHPHDITRIEDWDPPGVLYVHARNVFHHIGFVSTEASKNNEEFRAQWRELREDVCWQPEF
jgi:hypothetical protein